CITVNSYVVVCPFNEKESFRKLNTESCNVKRCMLLISIIVGILSFSQFYQNWIRKAEVERNNQAVRTPFFIAHVIDPTVESGFKSWTSEQWLSWLRTRDNLHQRANPNRRTALTEKGLNSYNPTKGDQQGISWEIILFPSIVFLRSGKNYRIYDCPPMYINVKLVRGMPVHLHTHWSNIRLDKKVKPSEDCKLLLLLIK
ncbi:hypothetical protein Ocin01_14529, partial [Orchesella cincta]